MFFVHCSSLNPHFFHSSLFSSLSLPTEKKIKLDKAKEEERDLINKEHVENLKISDISDFPDHPFKVIIDDNMKKLSKSIEEYGVLVPVLVRPKQDGKYEMISGHRRKKASELA